MSPHAEITRAATALRTRTAAVPGFCEALPDLLEACAGIPGEAGELALAVAQDILRPLTRKDAA